MVFGDSLTSFVENGPDHDLRGGPDDSFLTDRLVVEGYTASVSSLIGAATGDLASVTPTIPAPGADVLLIALGSNDRSLDPTTGQAYVSVATAIANIDAAVAQTAAECNIVVTVAETTPWNGLNQTAPAYNAALRALPGVVVADWALVAASHPEYLRPNDVHHTTAGAAAYMDLFVDAVNAC
jgi:lysophospholipase L1-like esterase